MEKNFNLMLGLNINLRKQRAWYGIKKYYIR